MLILGLIIGFALILYLVNKKVPIGIAIISGGILIALFSGLQPLNILKIMAIALIEPNTIELILTVILIGVLSSMMASYGVMAKMVEYLEKMFKSTKALLFIIPSLLSTFTVTGSAIVAAPVIDNLGEKAQLSKARRAAINLYIRHSWYFILPISVSLINASFIAGIPIIELIKVQIPVALICLGAAYYVYISPIADSQVIHEHNETWQQVTYNAMKYTSPLIIAILLVIWMPFYLALIISSFLTYFIRVKEQRLMEVIIKSKNLPLIYAAAGIMIFKDILENIPGIQVLFQQVINYGVPIEVIAILLTIVVGYITANVSAVVGMMYPLILPLVAPEGVIPMAMLIYTVGFCSYFISPIHLCQALTNEFFCISTTELYKEYKITVPVMFLSGLLIYYLLILF